MTDHPTGPAIKQSAPDGDRVSQRWHEWLRAVGPHCGEHQVVSHDRPDRGDPAAAQQVFVREMFVPTDTDDERAVDLLLVALLERGATPNGRPASAELVVVGPEAIRARTTAGPTGLTVSEVAIGSAVPPPHRMSLVLVRIRRGRRAQDVAASVEELGRLLDHDGDPEGSLALAHALVRRLETLTAAPGVTVPVAGSVTRSGDAMRSEVMRLLSAGDLALDDVLELRDGGLMVAGRDRRPTPWHGGDYVILRVGRAARRGETFRSPAELRRRHQLAENSLGTETEPTAERFSSRAASARQTARAEQILRHVSGGDPSRAASVLATALTQPGAPGPLVESLVDGVTDVAGYWSLIPLVQGAVDDPRTTPQTRSIAAGLHERLGERLDRLLQLVPGQDSELFIPVTTPIVLEIGDGLMSIVDSRLDGGHFLYELIPAMRDRVRAATGVQIPGVRARGNPSLAPSQFSIQIDEAPKVLGSTHLGGYRARAASDDQIGPPGGDIVEIHPETSEWGRWHVTAAPDDAPEDEAGTFSSGQYLAHSVERVARANLHRLLGIQEVGVLLNQWQTEDAEAFAAAELRDTGIHRLTFLLQDLVAEWVPIADWKAILDAVARAGGLTTDLRTLKRAVRLRLRDTLPGPRSGPQLRHLPWTLQQGLAVTSAGAERARLDLLTWLQASIKAAGPVLSVVTDDAPTREAVAVLARTHHAVVLTFTAEEVSGG
jgi:hypothetical protein